MSGAAIFGGDEPTVKLWSCCVLHSLNLKEGSGSLSKGKVGTPDVTITVTDKIFLQLGEYPLPEPLDCCQLEHIACAARFQPTGRSTLSKRSCAEA